MKRPSRAKIIQRRAVFLAALRSGKYKQCFGPLRETTPDGGAAFCALGLLCHIHDKRAWHNKGGFWYYGQSTCSGYPPQYVLTACGIAKRVTGDMITWNDRHARTFSEIADLLEETWDTAERCRPEETLDALTTEPSEHVTVHITHPQIPLGGGRTEA